MPGAAQHVRARTPLLPQPAGGIAVGTMACRTVDDDTFRRLTCARDFLAAGYGERVTFRRAAREACLSPFHAAGVCDMEVRIQQVFFF